MRRIVGIFVSLAILAVIYWQIDLGGVLAAFSNSHPGLLVLGLALLVPLTVLPAVRLTMLMPKPGALRLAESTRLVLLASVLNMVLPSKMGDIAKAYALSDRCEVSGPLSFSLVVFEKAWDMAALLAWCALGLILIPAKGVPYWGVTALVVGLLLVVLALTTSPGLADRLFAMARWAAPAPMAATLDRLRQGWAETLAFFWRAPSRSTLMIGLSIFIWFLHLVQIWLFILALNEWAPFVASLALAPLAILIGLLPFTIAGIGTRDAALIVLFAPYLAAPAAAALGLLCTLRYVVPALAGLPFLGSYLATARRLQQQKI